MLKIFRYLIKAFEKYKDKLISKDNLIGRIEVEIEKIIDKINDNKLYTLLSKYVRTF